MKSQNLKVECEHCGKVFPITPSRLKNKSHACSKLCRGRLASEKFSQKVEIPCVICGIKIKYKQSHFKQIAYHTCSAICSAKSKSIRIKGEKNPKALNLTPFQKIFWNRYLIYKYRAKAKNMEFDITPNFLEDLFIKQNKLCYFTDYPLKVEGKKSFDTLSLDRLDSQGGYTQDNVVFCLNCINMMKAEHSLIDIEKVFQAIIKKGSPKCQN